MQTAGAVPDARNALGAPKGAAAFPGSTGGAGLKPNLYPTNDAGTGPAPVGGGSFQPLNGAGGFGSAPLSAAEPGLTLGGGGGGGSPAAGGVSFAQAAPVTASAATNGGRGGDGLVRAPGARSAPGLGIPDTQAATTTLTGTGPGGLPIRMTVGRRMLGA